MPASSGLPPARHIENGRELFAVPAGFEVWALPAVLNYVVEQQTAELWTFPTIVDEDELLPGEKLSDGRLGHGAWVFCMPLQQISSTRT